MPSDRQRPFTTAFADVFIVLPAGVQAISQLAVMWPILTLLRRGSEQKIVSHYVATFATDDPYPELPDVRGRDAMLDGLVRAYGGASLAMRTTSCVSRSR
jgi:hypothetical protein